MTENLLSKLEEKIMTLLSEVEDLRKETQKLSHENSSLKIEKENHAKKLHDLISLLDVVNGTESMISKANLTVVEPISVQG
jgi:regulator of replication initiation timing